MMWLSIRGTVIRFYKRAQILVGDLAGSLDQAGLGAFRQPAMS